MIRLALLSIFVSFLSIYAWKDWFKSLCGLIVLMAVIEHPDMPKTLLGIQGMNPWNILFANVFLSWFFSRKREGNTWDLPKNIQLLLTLYITVMIVGTVRLFLNVDEFVYSHLDFGRTPPSIANMVSENLVNTFKWLIPGLLLFDGSRTKSRINLALGSILLVYFILAVQVVKWMPLEVLTSGGDLTERSGKILSNEVGYHRVNLSMMLAGASWAFFTLYSVEKIKRNKFIFLFASLFVFFAQALTGGRTGYATWAVIGAILSSLKWRRYLVLAPIFAVVILLTIPAVKERLLMGFSPDSADENRLIEEVQTSADKGYDLYTITSGRNFAWPFVIEKIAERPMVGFGREAMMTQGISSFLWTEYRESFPHPHNMYLQWVLDNGILGLIPILILFGTVLKYSVKMFLSKESDINVAVGGITISLVSALMIAGMGSQTIYPREGSVGMWCAIGLLLRLYVDSKNKNKIEIVEPVIKERPKHYG
jgi:O-antigen ligase